MNILIVEDDTNLLGVLMRLFYLEGVTNVRGEDTLSGGLQAAKEFKPQLTVLDLAFKTPPPSSPAETVEVIPQFAEANPEGAILVYSGYANEELRARALELGAHVVAEKSSSERGHLAMNALRAVKNSGDPTCEKYLKILSAVLGQSFVAKSG